MLRLVADADFHGDLYRGLLRHPTDFDIVRVQDLGLRTSDDATILHWAARNHRIVITHDRATMPDFAIERIQSSQPMPGLFVVRNSPAIGRVIDQFLLIASCSEPTEWDNRIVYLPL